MKHGGRFMKLVINGKTETVDLAQCTIQTLLHYKDVKMPEMVSVEFNGRFLKQDEYAATIVSDGDQIEFLYFMGGGTGGVR